MSCPVEYTCPKINEALEAVQKAESLAVKNQDSEDVETLQNALGQVESALYGIESIIEEIRQANTDIREWGESQEARACDAELEIIGE